MQGHLRGTLSRNATSRSPMGTGVRLVRRLYADPYGLGFVENFEQHFKRTHPRPKRPGHPWERWDIPEMRQCFSVEAREPREEDAAALREEYETLLAGSVRADASFLNPEEMPSYEPPTILPLPWFTRPDGPTFGFGYEEAMAHRAIADEVRASLGIPAGVRVTSKMFIAKVVSYSPFSLEVMQRLNEALICTYESDDPEPLARALEDLELRDELASLAHAVILDPTRPDLRAELRNVIVQVRRQAREGVPMRIDRCKGCGGLFAMRPDGPRYCDGHGGACSRAASRLAAESR